MDYTTKDKNLKKSVEDLPVLSPREGTWESIEMELKGMEVPTKRVLPYRAVAAVILMVLVSAYGLWRYGDSTDANIQFSEELGVFEGFLPEDLIEDVAFDEFLAEECADTKAVCEDESLHQLLDQLQALRSEAMEMVELINDTGYDQYLIKAKSRLERENAQVKREIMALLRG
ncbi:hypothetical protein [Roseivirga sp. E12]|uniref:hypothetical protein n=1 Tax=Roseivirga sp. E12 TaxID=2819237 RepID=UPI001ABC7202|nr:hypothetical protein [Roseivirga sp. E12]MBO3700389.1 hypothetical protein [Roseivirga sp. E12]